MNLTINQQRLYEVLKFLVLFNVLSIPLHILMVLKVDFYPLASIERAQVAFFLNLFDISYGLSDVPVGNFLLPAIEVNNNVMAIGEACTAIRILLAFTALVIASPRSWTDKKKAWVFLPLIYLANIFRITSLAFVSISFPSMFELVHIFFWREGLIALILLCWAYWFTQLAESRPLVTAQSKLQL